MKNNQLYLILATIWVVGSMILGTLNNFIASIVCLLFAIVLATMSITAGMENR